MPSRRRVLSALASALALSRGVSGSDRPNVLLIAVDDLNDWVSPLGGHSQARTPNLDALARRGLTFARAYSPAPLCTPSRAAALTGLSPRSMRITGHPGEWSRFPAVPTLPRFFRDHGYYVVGSGKIYHERHRREEDFDEYYTERRDEPQARVRSGIEMLFFTPLDAPDGAMRDHDSLEWVAARLRRRGGKPFFAAWGLHKPHLPWEVPKRYFDLHPLGDVILPLTREDDLDDVPAAGRALAGNGVLHRRIVASGQWREAVRGYLAAVSFMDAMVGQLLQELESSGESARTVVVFWSDNGWHLGEKQCWRKFTLWEESTRVPLILAGPGVPAGARSPRTVDHTSLFATLAGLAGLPLPKHVQGPTLAPLLEDPEAPWERPAVSSYLDHDAVRSEEWRYVRYADGSEELYDERRDPHEWANLAARPELKSVKASLARWLEPRAPRASEPTSSARGHVPH